MPKATMDTDAAEYPIMADDIPYLLQDAVKFDRPFEYKDIQP
jgi:hypothetical protein